MSVNDLLNAKVSADPVTEAKEPEVKKAFGEELNDLRQRVVRGEEVSREELRAALVTLREVFGKKVEAPKKKGKTTKKAATKVKGEDAMALLAAKLKGN